jgi:hypothetical protein
MWGSLFGGGATAAKKKQDAAKNSIVGLREQVNMLEKKEAHLQKQIDELTATAKRNVQTNKKGTHSPPMHPPLPPNPSGQSRRGGVVGGGLMATDADWTTSRFGSPETKEGP